MFLRTRRRCACDDLGGIVDIVVRSRAQINPNAHQLAGVYDEQTTQPNAVDFTATGSSLTVNRFAARIRDAYLNNRGGVLDGTILGQYASFGKDNNRQFSVAWGSQGIGTVGSQAISGTGAFATPSKNSSFGFVGFDVGGLPNEHPVEVGLTALSQTGAGFGAVTVSGQLDNGTSMSATRTISENTGAGDTFYGFTAPAGRYFTGMSIQHNSSTFTAIRYDDVAFRTAVVASNRLEKTAAVDAAASAIGGGNYAVTDGATSVNVRNFSGSTPDTTKGILEFDISSIPAGAKVTGATLEFDVSQFTSSGADTNQISILGYAGDGVATPADGSRTGPTISTRSMESLGLMAISLDASYLQSLAGQSNYLGLLANEPLGWQMSFNTNEDTFKALAPTLTVDYTPTPEPASVIWLALGTLALRRTGRKRLANAG